MEKEFHSPSPLPPVPIPPTDIQAAIDIHRGADELVWDWRADDPGAVVVFLIRETHVAQAERMISVGLAGGEGRCLKLIRLDDSWTLGEISRWIG